MLDAAPPGPPARPSPRTSGPSSGARARARAEITREIKDVARRQLAEVGSAGLSLRAVAREVGMVSSAVYRYFPSRDELLTALIIDAYDALGEAVEVAEGAVSRRKPRQRWLAATRAVRTWAVEHREEYALIYGSPVPGYAAPEATIGPATRVSRVLMGILEDHVALHDPDLARVAIPRSVRADLDTIQAALGTDVPAPLLLAGLRAWTDLYGTVSFELFGQLQNVIGDPERYFDLQMQQCADSLGL